MANGTGDDLGKEGYTGRLRELLAPRGWEVLNQSRGGDNTKTMAPRFAPQGDTGSRRSATCCRSRRATCCSACRSATKGIQNGTTKAEKDAIYAQFETGMRGFVDRSRAHHIYPIVTLCYTRNDFTAVEYEYTRRMNLEINSWDVPSVNFLGAVDDGTGKWAKGFWHDALHPNAAGHVEITRRSCRRCSTPSSRANRSPKRSTATAFARVGGGDAPITFTPEDPMHPFAFGVTVRAQADGTLASIAGSTLAMASEMKREERAGGRGALEFEASTLTAGAPFTETIGISHGVWTLKAANGTLVSAAVKADTQWHHLVVSHYTARGETLFYVDGTLAGRVAERLEPKRFALGGPASADFKNLLIYRSALNGDEVSALERGTLLQASLEVYSPLDDAKLVKGGSVENRAQSLTSAKVGSGKVAHVTQ